MTHRLILTLVCSMALDMGCMAWASESNNMQGGQVTVDQQTLTESVAPESANGTPLSEYICVECVYEAYQQQPDSSDADIEWNNRADLFPLVIAA